MAKLVYDASLVDSALGQLRQAKAILGKTDSDLGNAASIIKSARGIEYIDVGGLSSIVGLGSKCQEYIDQVVSDINNQVDKITEYNAEIDEDYSGFFGFIKRAGATVVHASSKLFEGIGTAGEQITDGFASAVGWVAGGVGDLFQWDEAKQLKSDIGEFVAKDHVGDAFDNLYENQLSEVIRASGMTNDGKVSNVLKGLGVGTGYALTLLAGGAVLGGVSTGTTALAGAQTAISSVGASTVLGGVGGLGRGVQAGLQSGLSYDNSMAYGAKTGAIQAGATLAVGCAVRALSKPFGSLCDKVKNVFKTDKVSASPAASTRLLTESSDDVLYPDYISDPNPMTVKQSPVFSKSDPIETYFVDDLSSNASLSSGSQQLLPGKTQQLLPGKTQQLLPGSNQLLLPEGQGGLFDGISLGNTSDFGGVSSSVGSSLGVGKKFATEIFDDSIDDSLSGFGSFSSGDSSIPFGGPKVQLQPEVTASSAIKLDFAEPIKHTLDIEVVPDVANALTVIEKPAETLFSGAASLATDTATQPVAGLLTGEVASLATDAATQPVAGLLTGEVASLATDAATQPVAGLLTGEVASLATDVATQPVAGLLTGEVASLATDVATQPVAGLLTGEVASLATETATQPVAGLLTGTATQLLPSLATQVATQTASGLLTDTIVNSLPSLATQTEPQPMPTIAPTEITSTTIAPTEAVEVFTDPEVMTQPEFKPVVPPVIPPVTFMDPLPTIESSKEIIPPFFIPPITPNDGPPSVPPGNGPSNPISDGPTPPPVFNPSTPPPIVDPPTNPPTNDVPSGSSSDDSPFCPPDSDPPANPPANPPASEPPSNFSVVEPPVVEPPMVEPPSNLPVAKPPSNSPTVEQPTLSVETPITVTPTSLSTTITPVVQTTPIVPTTPVVQTTPIVPTTPVVQTTPIVSTTPVIQTIPIVSTTPVIQTTPIVSTTPATPSIYQEYVPIPDTGLDSNNVKDYIPSAIAGVLAGGIAAGVAGTVISKDKKSNDEKSKDEKKFYKGDII
ncbi:MAG: hypothetical protein IKE70_03220 [Bacilli bacterium]|nr:hypothetical protein [Bacilli bacterium]